MTFRWPDSGDDDLERWHPAESGGDGDPGRWHPADLGGGVLDDLDDDEIFEWVVGRGTGDQDASERITDVLLAARIGDALRCDPLVHGRHLEVMVQNNVAILIGELGSVDARKAAARRTWTVPGVRDVCNRLSVTQPGQESRRLA